MHVSLGTQNVWKEMAVNKRDKCRQLWHPLFLRAWYSVLGVLIFHTSIICVEESWKIILWKKEKKRNNFSDRADSCQWLMVDRGYNWAQSMSSFLDLQGWKKLMTVWWGDSGTFNRWLNRRRRSTAFNASAKKSLTIEQQHEVIGFPIMRWKKFLCETLHCCKENISCQLLVCSKHTIHAVCMCVCARAVVSFSQRKHILIIFPNDCLFPILSFSSKTSPTATHKQKRTQIFIFLQT